MYDNKGRGTDQAHLIISVWKIQRLAEQRLKLVLTGKVLSASNHLFTTKTPSEELKKQNTSTHVPMTHNSCFGLKLVCMYKIFVSSS